MGPVEALHMAMAKEIDSKDTYTKLLSAHPSLKDTFLFLINEEEKHMRLIEQKIIELTR
jgi:rubrerythrin